MSNTFSLASEFSIKNQSMTETEMFIDIRVDYGVEQQCETHSVKVQFGKVFPPVIRILFMVFCY